LADNAKFEVVIAAKKRKRHKIKAFLFLRLLRLFTAILF